MSYYFAEMAGIDAVSLISNQGASKHVQHGVLFGL